MDHHARQWIPWGGGGGSAAVILKRAGVHALVVRPSRQHGARRGLRLWRVWTPRDSGGLQADKENAMSDSCFLQALSHRKVCQLHT